MSEFHPEKPEKRPENEVLLMSAVAEASSLLRQAAEPRPGGELVKATIARVARYVSRHLPQPMSPGRAEDIWRQEARMIRAEEMDAIRAAADARRLREARDEFRELNARIAQIEATLLLSHPDADGAEDDALRAMARGPHRPMGGRR